MTPQQAEDIYYAAYRDEGVRMHMENKLVDQNALRMACWQAVIDAVTKEIDTDWAKRFLAFDEYHKGTPKV